MKTTSEVAQVLGVTRQRVQQLAVQFSLGKRISRLYLFRAWEIKAMQRRNRKPGPPKT